MPKTQHDIMEIAGFMKNNEILFLGIYRENTSAPYFYADGTRQWDYAEAIQKGPIKGLPYSPGSFMTPARCVVMYKTVQGLKWLNRACNASADLIVCQSKKGGKRLFFYNLQYLKQR